MIIFRLTNARYKEDLSGQGAKLFGGRWNIPNYATVYLSEHISLCILETLVNITLSEASLHYYLLKINIPDTIIPTIISTKKLKINWQDDISYTQFIGTEFLKNKQSLMLKMPSAIVTDENNFLLNPLHSDFKKVSISKSQPFKFDNRLFNF